MTKYLLAHDIGTSGDKAALFREDGTLVKSIIRAYPTYYSAGGCVEQSPDEWWQAVCDTTNEILTLVDKKDVAAVSFGGQMMGVLCLDKTGTPLRNSIIWADTRSQKEADYIEEHYGRDEFYATTGHRISPSHSITKLMWVRDHQPDIYKNTYKTLNSKDYIVFKLTGKFVTDYSDASSTLAYNINTRAWADDVIETAGLDIDKFPEIKSGLEVVGYVTESAAAECGLLRGTPVVLGGGDGCMARIGSGCVEPGGYNINLGTSAVNGYVSDTPAKDPLQRIVTWNHIDPRYVSIAGTMQACGASISWMRHNLCQAEEAMAKQTGESIFKYINENAAKSTVGSNGLLFLPYMQGERSPRWNAQAKGVFVGLTMKHTIADMQHAVMEGVCLNMGVIHNIIKENVDAATLPTQVLVSGGAAKSPIVSQALADIYNMSMATTNLSDEAGSLGAAIVAGHGVGLYPDITMAREFMKITHVVDPIPANVEKYKEIIEVFNEAYEAMVPIYPKLQPVE
ncbi:MAG: xylulokinase [Christensenellaceae bacterium]|nr:xylulokinase [Christensenellaceae bacterium]